MKYELMRLEHLQRIESDTPTLQDVSFSLFKEESICICVRSPLQRHCLVNVLSGYDSHNGGKLYINDIETVLSSPDQARSLGIYRISSKPVLNPYASVAENIYVTNNMPYRYILNRINMMQVLTAELLEQIGFHKIDPTMPARALNIALAHIVELMKVIILGAKVILLENIFEYYSDKYKEIFVDFFVYLRKSGIYKGGFIFFTNSASDMMKLIDRQIIISQGITTVNINKTMCTHDENNCQQLSQITQDPDAYETSTMKYEIIPKKEISLINKQHSQELCLQIGEIRCILDENQLFWKLDLDYIRHHMLHYVSAPIYERQPNKYEINNLLEKNVCVINCHQIDNFVVESLNLERNITLVANYPIYNALGVENKRLVHYLTKKLLTNLKYDKIYNKYKDSRYLKGLSNMSKFIIFLARMLVIHPKVIFIVDPQICFDDLHISRFSSLINDVKNMNIGIVVISSTENILTSLSDSIIDSEDFLRSGWFD